MYVIKLRSLLLYIVVACLLLGGFTCLQHAAAPVSGAVLPQPEDGVTLPVLMYHGITKEQSRIGKYVISYEMFENDLQYLRDNGYTTVLIQDLINYVNGAGDLPEKPVLLTFDDGYYNNYLYGFELLKKYRMKAVISIIGTWTENYSQTGETNPNYSHITWAQIREMQASGLVEVQNHSYDMHTNNKGRDGAKMKSGESVQAYARILTEDIGKLQDRMQEETGCRPTCFTYPYGGISDASVDIIKQLGFQASLSCEEKLNVLRRGDPDCLYRMNRYLRTNNKSAEKILEKALQNT